MPDSQNGNNRVTLAVLKGEIEHLREIETTRHRQVMELLNRAVILSEANSKRITDVEREQAAGREREDGRWRANEDYREEHNDRHNRESGLLAGLSVIGTAAASVLAWFK